MNCSFINCFSVSSSCSSYLDQQTCGFYMNTPCRTLKQVINSNYQVGDVNTVYILNEEWSDDNETLNLRDNH